MVQIYHSSERKIVISKFSGILTVSDIKTCENIYDEFFKTNTDSILVSYFTPDAKIVDLNYIIIWNCMLDKYNFLFKEIYFTGVTGTLKIFLNLYRNLSKIPNKLLLNEHHYILEKKLSVNLNLPNREFEQLTFSTI